MADIPRGIRNNNPGNIRKAPTQWVGQIPGGGDDPAFVQFTKPEYGLRALSKTLLTYQNVHGLFTVAAIIGRWAPPFENDTASYVDAVASEMGVGQHDHVDLKDPARMAGALKAIVRHENGQMPYDDATIKAALTLAGIGVDERLA